MKKILAFLLLLSRVATNDTYAIKEEEFVNPYNDPYLVRCTCYISERTNAKTKDGSVPTEGMIAGRDEDLGKTAILYRVDEDGNVGELIGFFDFTDTGSHEGLVDGSRVDIYRDSLDGCWDWVGEYGDYVYLQIVDAKG